MSDLQKSIEKYLTMPIEDGYIVHAEPVQRIIRYQQELIEQKDAQIARLTEQRNRTLANWGKTLDDAETLAAQLEKEGM